MVWWQRIQKRWRGLMGEHGQVLVLGALAMTVLAGAAGLALDAGVATVHRRAAQAAADAAALAGADDLTGWAQTPTPQQVASAITDATNWAAANNYSGSCGGGGPV